MNTILSNSAIYKQDTSYQNYNQYSIYNSKTHNDWTSFAIEMKA